MSITVPVSRDQEGAPILMGVLSLRSGNFLTDAGRTEPFGAAHLQTFVADRQGRILAGPDAASALSRSKACIRRLPV